MNSALLSRRIIARRLSTPAAAAAKPAEPVLAKVGFCFPSPNPNQNNKTTSHSHPTYKSNDTKYSITLQVYGGLKDQDRIFTNLYGEEVREVHWQFCSYPFAISL